MTDNLRQQFVPDANSIRRESRPFRIERLHPSQRQVLAKLVSLLQASVHLHDRDGRDDDRRELPYLEEINPNRNIFCSGKRGSGKTSLLMTLLRALEENETAAAGDLRSSPDEVSTLRSQIRQLGTRFVQLTPLDMEPLAQPTNLLAAILARLEAAAKKAMHRDRAAAGYELLSIPPGPERALSNLARLQSEIAMSWDTHKAQRSMSSDPDVFATTIRRMEATRLSINPRLHQVVKELAEHCFPLDRSPIFLLPVDDFDLAPERSVDLLKLLRMISVPGILTLICGDIDQLQEMLALSTAAELTNVGGTGGIAGVGTSADLGRMASHIASSSLFKMIPPSHVVRIEPLSYEEAMNFDPRHPNRRDGPGDDPLTIQQLLHHRARLDIDLLPDLPKHKTLLTMLNVQRIHADDQDTRSRHAGQHAYPGREYFKMLPRDLTDLWQLLHQLPEQKKDDDAIGSSDPSEAPDILDVLVDGYRRAVRADELLTPAQRRLLLDAVRRGFDGRWRLYCEMLRCRTARGGTQRVSVHPQPLLQASRPADWSFRVLDPDQPDIKDREHPMSDRTAAALLLLHDVLALGRPRGVMDLNLIKQQYETGWARAVWHAGGEVELYWPVVPWRSYWSFSKLRAAWCWTWDQLRSVISDKPNQREETERRRAEIFAYCWIADSTHILTADPETGAGAEDIVLTGEKVTAYVQDVKKRLPWTTLGQLIAQKTPPGAGIDRRQVIWQEWCCRLGALMSPEFGLPLSVAGRVIQAWGSIKKSKKIRATVVDQWAATRRVRELRASKYAFFAEKGLDDVGLMLVSPDELAEGINGDRALSKGLDDEVLGESYAALRQTFARLFDTPPESAAAGAPARPEPKNSRSDAPGSGGSGPASHGASKKKAKKQVAAPLKTAAELWKGLFTAKTPPSADQIKDAVAGWSEEIAPQAKAVVDGLRRYEPEIRARLISHGQDLHVFDEALLRVWTLAEFSDIFARSALHPMNAAWELVEAKPANDGKNDGKKGKATAGASWQISSNGKRLFCPDRVERRAAERTHQPSPDAIPSQPPPREAP